ncbi:hypothetical protein GCM10027035_45880 [Emticicia sediminis]
MTISLPTYHNSFEAHASWALSIPSIGSILYKPLISGYQKILLELTGYQSFIYELSKQDAQEAINSISKFQTIIEKIATKKTNSRNSNLQEFLNLVTKINNKINENNFLLTLIIEDEFDKSMSIEEMLEDYYDGLDAKNRAFEEKIPFETFLKTA